MKKIQGLKERPVYLSRLKAFQDSEEVKVISGIRRCGKSSLLKLMINSLIDEGKTDKQLLLMNFESMQYRSMTAMDLYLYVKERLPKNKRIYIFFDEIQHVPGWQDAVNSMRVDFDCDIYLTGSNAYLLSNEMATYLSGRYIEIKMLPLGFAEYISFHGYTLETAQNPLGGVKHCVRKDGRQTALDELFESYLKFGGFPGVVETDFNYDKALIILDGIYTSVIMRDVLERERRNNERTPSNPLLLKKIVYFLSDSIGSPVSFSSIGKALASVGLASDEKATPMTIQAYVTALCDAFIFYDIKRFDIKGKEFLKTLGKYYIADIGLRNFLLGMRNRDRGHILENVVFFELKRRGFDVSVGKIGDAEIDFIAASVEKKIYIQVAESLKSADVRKRELLPLQKIEDNYEKIILSLDLESEEYDGIKTVNLIEWLIRER